MLKKTEKFVIYVLPPLRKAPRIDIFPCKRDGTLGRQLKQLTVTSQDATALTLGRYILQASEIFRNYTQRPQIHKTIKTVKHKTTKTS